MTRIVLADDSVLLRTGLSRLLRDEGFDIVAELGDADELLVAVDNLAPDLAIVDIRDVVVLLSGRTPGLATCSRTASPTSTDS